jgi:hypothetical protein
MGRALVDHESDVSVNDFFTEQPVADDAKLSDVAAGKLDRLFVV